MLNFIHSEFERFDITAKMIQLFANVSVSDVAAMTSPYTTAGPGPAVEAKAAIGVANTPATPAPH